MTSHDLHILCWCLTTSYRKVIYNWSMASSNTRSSPLKHNEIDGLGRVPKYWSTVANFMLLASGKPQGERPQLKVSVMCAAALAAMGSSASLRPALNQLRSTKGCNSIEQCCDIDASIVTASVSPAFPDPGPGFPRDGWTWQLQLVPASAAIILFTGWHVLPSPI